MSTATDAAAPNDAISQNEMVRVADGSEHAVHDRLGDDDFNIEDTVNALLKAAEAAEHPRIIEDESEAVRDARKQNEMYARLNSIQRALKVRIEAQRHSIAELQQEMAAAQADTSMSAAQEVITELFTQINQLRAGATESEAIVREITRDIRNLDLMKRNITASITGIKRFQMLVVAFDQLGRHSKAKRYAECAQAMSAVKELAVYFKNFTAIDRIATVLRGVSQVQSELREQIMQDFQKTFAPSRDASMQTSSTEIPDLANACLVLDAIGVEAKNALLEWYCNLQLREYRRIFRPSEEAGQLDNLSRRFGWLRRSLKQYDNDAANVFPAAWNVPGCLLGAFVAVTRDDLKSVLVRVASGLTVAQLLEALKETKEFQAEMTQRLNEKRQKGVQPMSFEAFASLSPITRGTSADQNLSSVFEPYLGIFVDAQDRTLADMVANWRSKPKSALEGAALSIRPEKGTSSGEESNSATALVLPSSAELFHFYRETLEGCAQLSTKATFLDLCNVFKKWLRVYAEEVLGSYLSKGERRSMEGRTNQQELLQAATVLNTAQYCMETTQQLESRLRDRIHPDFKDRVSLESETELFTTVITAAVLSMLKELELSIEPALSQMLRSPWKDATIVSSESHYVLDLVSAINKVADVVKNEVEQRKYFRSWCDKAVGLIVARFVQNIVRSRPITPIGAEQILLDIQRLKSCLLQLPKLTGEGTGSSAALASYNRVVAKALGKIDIMLQVIMSPESPPEAFIDHYLVLIPCQSFSDFQKMLDLKGVKRQEQNNLLDLFLAKTSMMRDLADTSILSQLDMDTAGHSHTASPQVGFGNMSRPNLISAGASSIGGLGLGLPSLVNTSPNSTLAHNLTTLISSLPMLHGGSAGGAVAMASNLSASGTASRSGTPRAEQNAIFGTSEVGSKFGLKKIGRLFTQRDLSGQS